MSSYRGILFDYDGTLVQTMDDNFRGWRVALREQGIEIGPEDYFPFEGVTVHTLVENFQNRNPQAQIDAPKLIQRKEEVFKESFHFAAYPGVGEILDFLEDARIPRAIVTSARMERVRTTTPASFLSRFNAVIAGESSKRGKPFADPYIVGAEALRLSPTSCIVVENAPLGIDSGKAAGCFCVAVCTTNDKSRFAHADRVFDSMKDFFDSDLLRDLVGTA